MRVTLLRRGVSLAWLLAAGAVVCAVGYYEGVFLACSVAVNFVLYAELRRLGCGVHSIRSRLEALDDAVDGPRYTELSAEQLRRLAALRRGRGARGGGSLI